MTKAERDKLEAAHLLAVGVATWIDEQGGARLHQQGAVRVMGIAAALRSLLASQPEEPRKRSGHSQQCWDANTSPTQYVCRCLSPQPEEEPGPTWHCACCEGLTKRESCPGLPAPEVVRSVTLEEAAKAADEPIQCDCPRAPCDHDDAGHTIAARIRSLAEAKRGSGGGEQP